MTVRAQIGRLGEDTACQWLIAKGHTILERNWRCSHYEIDIISMSDDGIHFVEVKSRVAPMTAQPEENVNQAKQRKITAAALRYMATGKASGLGKDLEMYFDIVSVVFDGASTRVEYFPQAWIPMYY